MNRSTGAFVLMLGGALFAQDIHFKTRTLQTAVHSPEAVEPAIRTARHRIVQFDHAPGVEDLDRLLRDGFQVVGALPDNAVVLGASAEDLPLRNGRTWTGLLQASDKVSSELPDAAELSDVVVEFHSDVSREQQDAVAAAEGMVLQRPAVLRPDHAIANGTMEDFEALATHDAVAYIFPADPALMDANTDLIPCLGMLTSSGPVGQYANIVHGWDLGPDNMAHLGYFFGSITPKVPASTVQSEIVRAFNEWAKITNLVFQPAASASSPRSVVVKFVSGAHGDAWPFDGPGGVLAHTFYPVPVNTEPAAGDMHLDADENWHAGGDLDIYSVALHEAGHAIGLGHSDKVGDVMYPYYRNGRALSSNDIGAARTLYGALASASPVSAPIAPGPLRLTLDAAPQTTQSSSVALTGSVSGGTAPWSIQWQTDRGYSGRATLAGNAWSASGITLTTGPNNMTVTALDAAQQAASQTISTVYSLPVASPSAGSSPPISITISSPASAVTTVSGTTLTISGKAAGGAGLTRVTWQTAAGATGTALGTNSWVAQNVPLFVGTNTIIVRAWDERNAYAWAAMVAVRH